MLLKQHADNGKYSMRGCVERQGEAERVYVYGKYSTRGCVERQGEAECYICLETPPECYILCTHKDRWCFKCFIVLPGRLCAWSNFHGTLIASIFGDHTISKLSNNLFVVVEFGRISLASFKVCTR